MTKICQECGNENQDTAGFCENCGSKLGSSANASKPNKTSSSSGGFSGWWNKQSTGGKAAVGFVGICCIGLILIVAISGIMSPDQNTSTTTQSSTTQSPATQTVASATPTVQPITLSGTGQEATQNFHLNGGLTRVNMTHSGSSNFIIHLVNANDGSVQELLVNEIGNFNGSRAFSVPAGDYLLDVQADGHWTVTITQG